MVTLMSCISGRDGEGERKYKLVYLDVPKESLIKGGRLWKKKMKKKVFQKMYCYTIAQAPWLVHHCTNKRSASYKCPHHSGGLNLYK